jgi:hypothetical protein
MRPVRVQILTSRHAGKQEMDVIELVASRFGNAIHDSLERIKTPGVIKEERVKRKITVNGIEYTVTGKFDVLEEKEDHYILRDIKTTSVWAYIHGKKDDTYREQLSIYRWLLSETKSVDDVAYIDFFFTDWQSSKAKTEYDYPDYRIKPGYKVDLWSLEDTEKFIIDKLSLLQKFEPVEDNQLPECTPEELWAQPDVYAVYKPKNKKATKLCPTRKEAEIYIADKKVPGGYIQFRPGKVRRCKYCPAAPFCNQYKDLQQKGMIDNF